MAILDNKTASIFDNFRGNILVIISVSLSMKAVIIIGMILVRKAQIRTYIQFNFIAFVV